MGTLSFADGFACGTTNHSPHWPHSWRPTRGRPPIVAANGVAGWIATVELSVQIRSRPQGEWLACLFDNNVIAGGSVSWDGTITDEWGRLVATCRQLALMPRS